MAPGGPWDAPPCPETSKRWHGDPLPDIFDLLVIFAQKHRERCTSGFAPGLCTCTHTAEGVLHAIASSMGMQPLWLGAVC